MKFTLIRRRKSVSLKNNLEFITWMRKNDSQLWETNQLFMDGYAYRKLTFENISIDYQNEDEFIKSMEKNNLLKITSKSKSFWNLFKKHAAT